MRQWEVLTVRSRSLAVVDVSGSMDFTDRGRKRISLAISAAQGALELFPDNAELGLWAFSIGLGGGNQDYLSLLPVRSLASTAGGVSHRESLMEALRELPDMTNGGTGLYDTTLAAVRSLRADYDPGAVNTVILLTDGKNEDPGSLSLKELLSKLERERDPGQSLEIIAIGMGPDADAKALERIAKATGGRSYIARDPSDIAKVFIDAMLNR
jgi:Mg-chelatase subunit ChlD